MPEKGLHWRCHSPLNSATGHTVGGGASIDEGFVVDPQVDDSDLLFCHCAISDDARSDPAIWKKFDLFNKATPC